jgi:hypothetical protein
MMLHYLFLDTSTYYHDTITGINLIIRYSPYISATNSSIIDIKAASLEYIVIICNF